MAEGGMVVIIVIIVIVISVSNFPNDAQPDSDKQSQ
jgi:hypothetical protein